MLIKQIYQMLFYDDFFIDKNLQFYSVDINSKVKLDHLE